MKNPPYKIPLMAEINRMPKNKLRVVSTFSGGGGSGIGYRWAGCEVIWANEFMPKVCETYRTNFPHTVLDGRPIQKITAEQVLKAVDLTAGEIDILDGSPPCQGFSMANQNRMLGISKTYGNGVAQKNEDMFFEFVRLLDGLKPKMFIAENVKGLTSGSAKELMGVFQNNLFPSISILHALIDCGYNVRWKILNAADYGTPQSRARVFFVGVRKDLKLIASFPPKLGYQYSVLDALPHLAGNNLNARASSKNGWQKLEKDIPCPVIMAEIGRANPWNVTIKAGKKGGRSAKESGKPYNLEMPISTIMAAHGGGVDQFQIQVQHGSHGKIVWKDGNQPHSSIMAGDANRKSDCMPTGMISIGYSMGQKPNKEKNTFFRNKKESANKPIRTLSSCGAAGLTVHVVSHESKRKFTIAELKRLGGFPDDYQLLGSYTQQWSIVGNSVCPPQMFYLVSHLKKEIFDKL